MNADLQSISNIVEQSGHISEDEKNRITRSLKKAESTFEGQHHELEIESASEKVRAIALSMKDPADMPEVCKVIALELDKLSVKEIRNVQTAVFYEEKGTYMNYEYYAKHDKTLITETSYTNHEIQQGFADQMIKGKGEFYTTYLNKSELVDWLAYQKTTNVFIDTFLETAPSLTYYWYSLGPVALGVSTYRPLSKENTFLFKRFLNVFELAYRRYLDIELAIAQAKEARIETALERVRAVAMAMRRPDDLAGIGETLFTELKALEFAFLRNTEIIINNDNKETVTSYYYSDYGITGNIEIDYNENPTVQSWITEMKKADDAFAEIIIHEDEMDAWIKYREEIGYTPDPKLNDAKTVYYYSYSIGSGALSISSFKAVLPEQIKMLERFRNVFNLSYQRYVDIAQAEAQAREAQIEVSLERVRSRALAMHKTDELLDAAELLYKELSGLGIVSMAVTYSLMDEEEKNAAYYSINPVDGKVNPMPLSVPHTETEVMRRILSSWKKQDAFNLIELDEQATLQHQTWVGNLIQTYFAKNNINIPFSVEAFLAVSPKKAVIYTFNFNQGYVFVIGGTRLTTGQEEMVLRFTKVFELTYRRFLDLKQSEEQVREANIEASLERVRSRTMAMHNSQDVGNTVAAMFDELVKLDIKTERCGILIGDESDQVELWTARSNRVGEATLIIGKLDMNIHPLLHSIHKAWNNKEQVYTYELLGEDLKDYYRAINQANFYPVQFEMASLPSRQFHTDFFFPDGALFAFTQEPLSADAVKIFKRFAGVFALTYRRYLDLQKAEEQAREATIEAALEKVRGRAMAMQNSNDLSATASIVFIELRKLGINPIRCGVGLLNKESRKALLYSATSFAGVENLSLIGWVMLSGHPVLENIYESWLQNEEYFPELAGEQLKSYYELLLSGLAVTVPDWQNGQVQFGNFLPVSVGCLYLWSTIPYKDDELRILRRFATIIDLTFRRYMELQNSEVNARDAVKQAALDRVRAEIASMRTITDLDKITPLIWNELTILKLPFNRCGVFIMDDSQDLIHTFLSTPDGKAIGAFHIPFDTPGNISQVLSHWQNKTSYIDRWDEGSFTEFADTLVKQGVLDSPDQYLKTIPHGGFYLHFLPFLQGMLYVGNMDMLGEDDLHLIQSVADAFSTAFARYEDFNKLEAAKQQVEKTLTDLKLTQQQLVQSEKMASLGELTAGIAHEIQNPLNFVNNFSEVSNELIGEMTESLDKGDLEEAKSIAGDIRQNLEKINHHGKRADAIVKGMLLHSRSSSAVKEPTGINALSDEYIRLCYHGLRAKDKSFNATIKTDFDATIGQVNIIPQDIGRVILNLLTNAFYAVNEKKKQAPDGYDPTVSVSTKKTNNKIEISVADNGDGIPQKVRDKIFQPFFTTKPTGQGTGLGLSLSYDIVKAHGGEIWVESKEGQGTRFIISLPTTTS